MSVETFDPCIERLLDTLPDARHAVPIGHRLAGRGCHGTRTAALAAAGQRIRFVYFRGDVADDDRKRRCHSHLVDAEILLGRMLAARAAGLCALLPTLDAREGMHALCRPPRERLAPATLECRRWYQADGRTRAVPLSQEALAFRLAADGEHTLREARCLVRARSHALPAREQAWLLARQGAAIGARPLDRADFRHLAAALDGIWETTGEGHGTAEANRRLALHVAGLLGRLLDDYTAPPFRNAALAAAFGEHHLDHLHRRITASRLADHRLVAGPKAWFAAKAERMRAEHQLGLAGAQPGQVYRAAGAAARYA